MWKRLKCNFGIKIRTLPLTAPLDVFRANTGILWYSHGFSSMDFHGFSFVKARRHNHLVPSCLLCLPVVFKTAESCRSKKQNGNGEIKSGSVDGGTPARPLDAEVLPSVKRQNSQTAKKGSLIVLKLEKKHLTCVKCRSPLNICIRFVHIWYCVSQCAHISDMIPMAHPGAVSSLSKGVTVNLNRHSIPWSGLTNSFYFLSCTESVSRAKVWNLLER